MLSILSVQQKVKCGMGKILKECLKKRNKSLIHLCGSMKRQYNISLMSHDHHHLKIHWNGSHENKFCQACILPITVSDRYYSCISCKFVLHETCASLPRRKHHSIHKHPLTLFHLLSSNPPKLKTEYFRNGLFKCDGCYRYCCGFMYKCTEEGCDFELDARCASLPDPSIPECHPHDHPLFFSLTQGQCMGCNRYPPFSLECIQCNSFLCLNCATLPSVAHYKHDKHALTLCCGEEKKKDLKYWCEICEGKLDATEWFYTCNSCSVTLHVTCLLGQEMYMKPNHTITINYSQKDVEDEVASNSGNSRPVCDGCRRRCMYALVFKWRDRIWCSLYCSCKRHVT